MTSGCITLVESLRNTESIGMDEKREKNESRSTHKHTSIDRNHGEKYILLENIS